MGIKRKVYLENLDGHIARLIVEPVTDYYELELIKPGYSKESIEIIKIWGLDNIIKLRELLGELG